MKKAICLLVALVLMFSLAVTAFAADGEVPVRYPVSSPVHIIESNPETGFGGSGSAIGAIILLGAAAAYTFSKKK